MKASSILSLGAAAGGILAQDVFEPSDFNVTDALIANGVDVSALPGLTKLTEKRSVSSPCAIAVGHYKYDALNCANKSKVQVTPTGLWRPDSDEWIR